MIRRAILATVTAALAGCGGMLPGSPSAPEARTPSCAVQSMGCFHFTGSLWADGRATEVEGWSEDMPTPGYANRWRYVVGPPAAQALAAYQGPVTGWVGGGAVIWRFGSGGMYMEALAGSGGERYWRLDMRPTDGEVAAAFAALAGAEEYRAQTFEVLEVGEGAAEILITEPE